MARATQADQTFAIFATCAGRLSALMEHQWITDGPASEQTAQHRLAMVSLVEAVQPLGSEAQAMALRVEAKAAHAALLARATFVRDGAAGQRAAALQAECLGLIGQS